MIKVSVEDFDPEGSGELTVSVKIEGVNDPTQPQTVKEIQKINIEPGQVQEQYTITIDDPDFGLFVVTFEDPVTGDFWSSEVLPLLPTNEQVYDALVGYFNRDPINSDIEVDVDIQGNVFLGIQKTVITITVLKLQSTPSSTKFEATLQYSESTIEVVAPFTADVGISSSAPLGGKFKILCGGPPLAPIYTEPLSYDASALEIQDALFYDCPELENLVEVYDSHIYRYPENGRELFIYFHGKNVDMIQFMAVTDTTEPLEGTPTLSEETIQEYDPTSVLFDPVPFEYIKTLHEKAQLEVTVDSVKAVCNMPSDCDYMAIDTGDDVIDTVVWDTTTHELSFDGSFFTTRDAFEIEEEINEIRFAGV